MSSDQAPVSERRGDNAVTESFLRLSKRRNCIIIKNVKNDRKPVPALNTGAGFTIARLKSPYTAINREKMNPAEILSKFQQGYGAPKSVKSEPFIALSISSKVIVFAPSL